LDCGELALIPAILFGVLVFLIPAIAHATSTKEYNGFAKKKKGRATCRVSAVMIALLGLAGAILTVVSPTSEDATMMPLIGIFAVAFVWFIVEQIFAAKAAKDEKKDVDPFEQAEARTKRIKKGRKAKKENKEKVKKEKAEKRKAKKEEKAEKKKAKKAEKVNQIVEEPKVVEEVMDEGLSAEIVALRDRWLNMEVESIPEEKPASDGKLLESQQVNCPNCKTIVDVPFGCTKVTCTNCETVFKMKKRLLK
jgi:LSD1 subclass zinc finger protein